MKKNGFRDGFLADMLRDLKDQYENETVFMMFFLCGNGWPVILYAAESKKHTQRRRRGLG